MDNFQFATSCDENSITFLQNQNCAGGTVFDDFNKWYTLVEDMTEDFSLKALVLGTITMSAKAESWKLLRL